MLKEGKNLLYAGIAIAAILVILCAALGYIYLDDQNRQNQKQGDLKQAFSDRLNETDRLYTLIGSYPAAGNKNIVDDFGNWVGGYRDLADNYSQAVRLMIADGAAYQCVLANDSSDYADVTRACNEARDRALSISNTAAGYEQEYQARLGVKNIAREAYDLALNQSLALYDTAWDIMQQNSSYQRFGGYHKFLVACEQNNSLYNYSISLVESAGSTYQLYLKGSEFYAVNQSILGLQDNSTKIGKRYADLQNRIPSVTVGFNDERSVNYDPVKGLYVSQKFRVVNSGWPMIIWDVVVHFKLIDKSTGNVRSTEDAPVTITTQETDYVFATSLPCDQNGEYNITYTISYEY